MVALPFAILDITLQSIIERTSESGVSQLLSPALIALKTTLNMIDFIIFTSVITSFYKFAVDRAEAE
ncbi:hypothetical protein [Breoghania sp. L-A4]|uniref:hypothetical protein n=1 Tax=Breoghania sp. L-A4 TaxID=2304600 RepID=UPI000E360A30|nr:hypothetical protein [Breoghania sp. L-A4]AXS42224.1 hypothetical protein D1F64_22310 [Breoghania sp. L-A4]